VVDLEGYFAPEISSSTAGAYVPLTPARITDTRPGSGQANSGATLGSGDSLAVQVTGEGGVPSSGVAAALLNVTVTDTTADSYLTVYPEGATPPLASNLNWGAGGTVANRVVVPVSATGQISVYNDQGSTDVVVDVNGYFTDGTSTPAAASLFTPISPVRVLDTRRTGQTLGAGVSLGQDLAGVDGIAANASAVVTNVTATDTSAASFFTVYPGGARPLASDLNWGRGQTVANLTVMSLSGTGTIDVYNRAGDADLVIDAFGYFVPLSPAPLVVTTTSLPEATLGVTYAATLGAYGGTPPYTWSVASGSLPAGLSLSSAGAISGAPEATGSFSFTVQVSDSTSPESQTASASLSISAASTRDLGNPAANDTTLANEVSAACNWSDSTVSGCEQASVSALDAAMTGEGLNPTSITASFWSLPYDQQLLFLANGDRTARGLPAILGPDATLDGYALSGAQDDTDPIDPNPGSWGSNWADDPNTVADEFLWMYDDGPGGPNTDCTSSDTAGCWAHRDNILRQWSGSADFGGACVSSLDAPFLPLLSCAEIFVQES
jgi:hypothetical protein